MFNVLMQFLFKRLPMPQKRPQSSPGCPTQPRGSPGQSGIGSGTAGSHAHDRRSPSVSCHSATSAQSGTGASHIADKADNVNCNNKHFKVDLAITAVILAYL